MADSIQFHDSVNAGTRYALLFNSAGQVWNGSAFVSYASASLGSYDLAATQQDTSSRFLVAVPAIPAGVYAVSAFLQAGGSPAESDPLIAVGEFEWDGTSIVPLSTRATQTSVDDVPTNAELATALGTADDAVLAAIAALNNLSSAGAQAAAAAALTAYSAATGANVTSAQTAILAKLPAGLSSNGNIKADVKEVADVPITGGGVENTDEWRPA